MKTKILLLLSIILTIGFYFFKFSKPDFSSKIYNQKECFLLFISNKDDSKLENQIEKLIEMEQ